MAFPENPPRIPRPCDAVLHKRGWLNVSPLEPGHSAEPGGGGTTSIDVDNSVFSPNSLTLPIVPAYPSKEAIRSPHFKQGGSFWSFMCSCSSSYFAWRGNPTMTGSIRTLPPQDTGPKVNPGARTQNHV